MVKLYIFITLYSKATLDKMYEGKYTSCCLSNVNSPQVISGEGFFGSWGVIGV